MLFERIEAGGLAHYSYLIGDGLEAAVVDPRRDAAIYEDMARANGMRITTILETHRNEDYVVGSLELARRTGARIWHADGALPYEYGEAAADGQTWRVGRLELEAVASPGHTPGSMSYLLRDPNGHPWVVFTGDALFSGGVGRTDLVDGRDPADMARLLHATIFERLLPLGDELIVAPGHGAGSICGADISDRVVSTIGLERKHNAKLQATAVDDFVLAVAAHRHRPPYFRRVEVLNLEGAPLPAWFPVPPPLSPASFEEEAAGGALTLDVRSEMAFGAAHVPGSLSIWGSRLTQFGGSLLPLDRSLLLVGDGEDIEAAARDLVRLGYDDVRGYLGGGMAAWTMSGRPVATTPMIGVEQLCHLIDADGMPAVLDVRTPGELTKSGVIPGAVHIELVDLPGRLEDVPSGRPLYVFCGSGPRSMMAASLLDRAGSDAATVVLGGTTAWNAVSCPLKR
jgi:hydroxyacylglutathione hydrolase